MDQLREVYQQVQQAEAHLQQLTEEAERKEPLLRPTKDALKAVRDYSEYGLAKEHGRFSKYISDSNDPKAIYRLYTNAKAIFSRNKIVDAINDPNQEKLLWKSMTYYVRSMSSKLEHLNFDPNDPNDERLWQNIKHKYFKRAPDEYLQGVREYYVKEKGLPEWLPDYAGNVGFADTMMETYRGAVFLLTPQEVRDAKDQRNKLYRKISKIYPSWNKLRHLLAGENNPDNEAVIRAVQEHMQLWPTMHRTVYRK